MADEGIYNSIDKGLNNFFGPINRSLENVVPKMSPAQTLMMALSAVRPGAAAMPNITRAGITPPKRMSTPFRSNNELRSLVEQHQQNVSTATRPFGPARQNPSAPNMRPQSFNAAHETNALPMDLAYGTRVMTPANRTPSQNHNMAIMRQLLAPIRE